MAYPFIAADFGRQFAVLPAELCGDGGFFLLAALPTFFWLRERAVPQTNPSATNRSGGKPSRRLASTRPAHTSLSRLSVYFIAYLFYTDAINTVIVASAIFANKVLDFSPGDLIIYFLITQITAGLGAVGFGSGRPNGAKRTISLTLILWIALSIAAASSRHMRNFMSIGLIAGAALGANQSASRTLLGQFTPLGRQGEFFGFFSVTGKFAAIIGPIVYARGDRLDRQPTWAVLSMAVFFLVGLGGVPAGR